LSQPRGASRQPGNPVPLPTWKGGRTYSGSHADLHRHDRLNVRSLYFG